MIKQSHSVVPKILGYLGGAAASGGITAKQLIEDLNETSGMVPGESMLMKLMMGVNPTFPIYKARGINNAYYNPLDDEAVYDTKFNKPGIIAHELGHKLIHEGESGLVLKLMQDYLYGPSQILGPIAAAAATPALTRALGKNPVAGALAGLAAGGVGAAGYLYPEYEASRLAKERYLKWRLFGKEDNSALLDSAYNTYLAAALGGPTALGIITGIQESKLKKSGLGVLKRLGSVFRAIARK